VLPPFSLESDFCQHSARFDEFALIATADGVSFAPRGEFARRESDEQITTGSITTGSPLWPVEPAPLDAQHWVGPTNPWLVKAFQPFTLTDAWIEADGERFDVVIEHPVPWGRGKITPVRPLPWGTTARLHYTATRPSGEIYSSSGGTTTVLPAPDSTPFDPALGSLGGLATHALAVLPDYGFAESAGLGGLPEMGWNLSLAIDVPDTAAPRFETNIGTDLASGELRLDAFADGDRVGGVEILQAGDNAVSLDLAPLRGKRAIVTMEQPGNGIIWICPLLGELPLKQTVIRSITIVP
jgi:hypothetical protein